MDGALGGGGSGQGGGGSVSPSLGLNLGGNSVKIPPALAGKAASAILILLDNLESLQGLEIVKCKLSEGNTV